MVKFDPIIARESQFQPDEHEPPGMRSGPCAMGPTDGDKIKSMHVWVLQNVPGGVAFSSGDSRERPVFESVEGARWRVPTSLDPGSREFVLHEPAVAVATAIVGDGPDADVRQWSQAVTIELENPRPGRTPPQP